MDHEGPETSKFHILVIFQKGMNDERMAISEIGAAYADYTFGKESRKGIPFTYLLRDVLQFDQGRFQ